MAAQAMVEETAQSKKEPEDSFPWKQILTELVKHKPIFESIQAILTSLGILAAGWWFLFSSSMSGKADCSQKLTMVNVSTNGVSLWLCSLEVKIENIGQREIKIKNARIFAESIQPQPQNFQLIYNEKQRTFAWGTLVFANNKKNYVVDSLIEPGEVDFEYFEFTLPTNVQVFKITSFLSKSPDSHYGWTKHSFYKMKEGQPIELSATDK